MTDRDGDSMRVLVIEDELKVARALEEGLTQAGYEVSIATDGEDGFYQVKTERFDLILLDLMLPGRDGLEILRTLREGGLKTPVLALTALDTVEDRVRGLDGGADDYLVKPFAFPELLARIRALRRRGGSQEVQPLTAGDLALDPVTRRVTRGTVEIDLTPTELKVLECLLRHMPHTVSRETIAREVWAGAARATPLDNVIDVHMARLRRKIDEGHETKLLRTVRGVGFVLGGAS